MVEADTCGMHKFLDDLSLAKAGLEAQQESLKEHLCLESNHQLLRPCGCRLMGDIGGQEREDAYLEVLGLAPGLSGL